MQLGYSEADESFRAELRAWLELELPKLAPQPARDAWTERRKWDTDWQRRLFDAGYAGLHWPAEFGGRGASPTEQLIFYEETARAARAVRRRELRRHAARGPDADRRGQPTRRRPSTCRRSCAAKRCGARASPSPAPAPTSRRCARRAERDGDDYVLNGQKIWCSFGQIADVGEFLVRTDPDAPKHRGISWLILPMDLARHRGAAAQDGARQLGVLRGVPHRRARPVANRVGAENDGWRVTNVTLKYERGTAFVSELVDSLRLCDDLAPLVHDPAASARARPLHRGARRVVGAHEAQRLAVAPRHRRARARW